MNSEVLTEYRGVFFGALAMAVALWPGIRPPHLHERGSERGGRSPVSARMNEFAEARRELSRHAAPAGAR
jgi:hypothetical protein